MQVAGKVNAEGLTDQQETFCQEYLIDLNATQAAIRAGYSAATANQTASRLLANVKLASRIEQLKIKRVERTEISADFVLGGLKEVAERCLQRKPVMEWDHASKSMVQAKDGDGNGVWEFDSGGANRAFELLGKHVGVFERDNSQKTLVNQPFNDKQVDKILEVLRETKAT